MTPDLYGAWLTAGNNLQPIGDWIAANWGWLAIAATAAFVIWRTWRIRPHDDYRTRNDQRAAWMTVCNAPRPEPAEPGHDAGLLLDCIAAYGDCADLDRLRNAIDQPRKGD